MTSRERRTGYFELRGSTGKDRDSQRRASGERGVMDVRGLSLDVGLQREINERITRMHDK